MGSFSTFRPSETGLRERSPGATATRVKSDIKSLAIVAALHLVIGGVHQYAHVVAGVENSPLEVLFIVLVVTIAPWATIRIACLATFPPGIVGQLRARSAMLGLECGRGATKCSLTGTLRKSTGW